MRPSQGFRKRLEEALARADRLRGDRYRISQTELAEMVGEVLGDSRTQASASLWMRNGVRDIDIIWALATALEVRPEWLALNSGEMLEEVEEAEPGVLFTTRTGRPVRSAGADPHIPGEHPGAASARGAAKEVAKQARGARQAKGGKRS